MLIISLNFVNTTGASFDNWLDAVDGSFCTADGGDNPDFVRPIDFFLVISFSELNGMCRMESTQIPCQVASRELLHVVS